MDYTQIQLGNCKSKCKGFFSPPRSYRLQMSCIMNISPYVKYYKENTTTVKSS